MGVNANFRLQKKEFLNSNRSNLITVLPTTPIHQKALTKLTGQ